MNDDAVGSGQPYAAKEEEEEEEEENTDKEETKRQGTLTALPDDLLIAWDQGNISQYSGPNDGEPE